MSLSLRKKNVLNSLRDYVVFDLKKSDNFSTVDRRKCRFERRQVIYYLVDNSVYYKLRNLLYSLNDEYQQLLH